jgi:hypothetical protein
MSDASARISIHRNNSLQSVFEISGKELTKKQGLGKAFIIVSHVWP